MYVIFVMTLYLVVIVLIALVVMVEYKRFDANPRTVDSSTGLIRASGR
jgi:hypothetical protein